jgi:alpha-1,3-glucosyltransferase
MKFMVVFLIFANPGILIVDHIHFQYNSFLYGIQLYSIAFFIKGRYLLGGLFFAIVLNFKHIFLYQAPAYFVFLLFAYCNSLGNFLKIGGVVMAVFGLSFGPFISHLPQILSRLFPFKRGLCHAYWAPNVWALYSFADRVLLRLSRLLGSKIDSTSLTR